MSPYAKEPPLCNYLLSPFKTSDCVEYTLVLDNLKIMMFKVTTFTEFGAAAQHPGIYVRGEILC